MIFPFYYYLYIFDDSLVYDCMALYTPTPHPPLPTDIGLLDSLPTCSYLLTFMYFSFWLH